jgi:hypothetical protein
MRVPVINFAQSHCVQLLCTDQMQGTVVTLYHLLNYSNIPLDFPDYFVSYSCIIHLYLHLRIFILPRYSAKEHSLKAVIPNLSLPLWGTPDKSPTQGYTIEGNYNLISIHCIEMSHYVTFACDSKTEKWYFFDSMSDKSYDQSILYILKEG